jgi:hypothetical protein
VPEAPASCRNRIDASRRWLGAAVELRLGKTSARLSEDLVGLAQLAVLALQRLQALPLIGGQAGALPAIALGLAHPQA